MKDIITAEDMIKRLGLENEIGNIYPPIRTIGGQPVLYMEWYAEYYYKQKLHKFLQYLSDEDELVGNRTHQQIIDGFKEY